jgi:hypothetical protein
LSEPITRPEFDNALTGLRREIQAMGEHIGSDLAQIRAQLTALLDTHHKEGREVGELTVRVEHNEQDIQALHSAHREAKNANRVMVGAVLTSLAGHLITWFLKGGK